MATLSETSRGQSSRPALVAVRVGLMLLLVIALVIISTPLRAINPLQLRIATNILFFVALGAVDEWLLAPVLNRWPLARTAMLVLETLLLGWFLAPGRVNPVPKFLFFTHIAPFFVAVFVGALIVAALRWRQRRHI